MNTIRLSFLFLCATIALGVRAQFPVSVIPPSVESINHFKHSQVTEALFTGSATIGIPIYTVKTRALDVPISMSYNTHGIKVGDVASRVGTGWSLAYGGRITRQTVGLPDESAAGILNQQTYYGDNSLFSSPAKRQQYYSYSLNHDMDKFSDYFFLELNGRSYKFIIDPTTKLPLLQKYDDIRIEVVGLNNSSLPFGIKGWVVTDSDGTKYYFGRSKDQSVQAYDYDRVNTLYTFLYPSLSFQQNTLSEEAFINTWQLMEIEDVHKDRITFVYEQEELSLYRKNYDLDGSLVFGETYTNSTIKSQFSQLTQYQAQLRRINFPNGHVLFNKATADRSDLPGGRALTSVQVHNSQGLISSVVLHQSSIVTDAPSSTVNRHLRTLDPAANNRLFLDSVVLQSSEPGRQVYRFTYDTRRLPNRHSTSQDNWGYYNGKANGEFLVFFDDHGHVDRSVDAAFSRAGLLTKVQYPSGGIDEFVYEANRGRMSTPSGNLIVRDIVGQTSEPKLASLLRSALHWQGTYFALDFSVVGITSPIEWSMEFPYPNRMENYDVFLHNRHTNVSTPLPYDVAAHFRTRLIPNGEYELRIIPHKPGPPNFMNVDELFIFRINWTSTTYQHPVPNDTEVVLGPGLRLKRVHKTDRGTTRKTTEYAYLTSANAESGTIHGVPGFVERNRSFPLAMNVLGQGSLPGTPFSTFSNGEIGYGNVVVYEGTPANNVGYTRYTFTNVVDGDHFYTFPYHPPRDNSWLRGHLLSREVYANRGGTYKLLESTANTYHYGGTVNDAVLTVHPQMTTPNDPGPPSLYSIGRSTGHRPYLLLPVNNPDPLSTEIAYKVYHFTGGAFDLATSTTRHSVYDTADQLTDQVVSGSRYRHDYPKNYRIHRIAQSSSATASDSLVTVHLYPSASDTTQGGNRLFQSNVIVPLTSTVSRGSRLIGTEKRHYTQSSSGIITLRMHEQLTGTPPQKKVYQVLLSDGYGNPLEVRTQSMPLTTYLWGYGGQYPIAKIENASYNEVKAALSDASGTFLNQLTSKAAPTAADLTRLNGLRNHSTMRKAQVSTYTYKPLVGMASMTDPRGITETYQYDGFQRMKQVLDFENNILQDYRYHYRP